jgi:hypothetical protein
LSFCIDKLLKEVSYTSFFNFIFNINVLKLSSIKKAITSYFNFNKINLTDSGCKVKNVSFSSKLYNFSSSEYISKYGKFKNKSKDMFFLIKEDINKGVRKVKIFKSTARRI